MRTIQTLLLLFVSVIMYGQIDSVVINHEMIKRFNDCLTFDNTKSFSEAMRMYKEGLTFNQIKDKLNGIKEDEPNTTALEE